MKNILFITGKLAQKGLKTVIESIDDKNFTYEIRNLNVNVAALLTTDMIERRIGDVSSFHEIIIPGRVRRNLDALKKNIIQNTTLLLFDCFGSAAGMGLTIPLKKLS